MRKNLTAPSDELLEAMEKVVMDSAKTQAICDCARASMGKSLLNSISSLLRSSPRRSSLTLADYRKKLQQYLSDKMSNVAPSLAALIGDVVGARLISLKIVDQTCQVSRFNCSNLGAEKAFPSAQDQGNTPKLVFFSTPLYWSSHCEEQRSNLRDSSLPTSALSY